MPQQHTYLLEKDTERIFRFNDHGSTIYRHDIRNNVFTHETPFRLPFVIYEEDTNTTHNLNTIYSVQPYKEKFFISAKKQNGHYAIYLVDSISDLQVSGVVYDNLDGHQRAVIDMTFWNDGTNENLLWCNGTVNVFYKNRDATAATAATVQRFDTATSGDTAGERDRKVHAVAGVSDGSDHYAAFAARVVGRPERKKSITLRGHRLGAAVGTYGYLTIRLKTGTTATLTNPSVFDYTNQFIMISSGGVSGTGANRGVRLRASQGNERPTAQANSLHLASAGVRSTITLEIQLKSEDPNYSTTLNEIAAAINNNTVLSVAEGEASASRVTASRVLANQFEAEVTGDGNATISWPGTAVTQSQGMKGYKLGTADVVVPTGTPFYSDFGDYDADERVFTTRDAAIPAINGIYITEATDPTDWVNSADRGDLNRDAGNDEVITYQPTGLALLSTTQILVAQGNGIVESYGYAVDSTTPFDSKFAAIPDTGVPTYFEDQTFRTGSHTSLAYEKQDNFLHVEGESIVSLQGMTAGGENGNTQYVQKIDIFRGHNHEELLLHGESTQQTPCGIRDINIPINHEIISYEIVNRRVATKSNSFDEGDVYDDGLDGRWLLTTWSSK